MNRTLLKCVFVPLLSVLCGCGLDSVKYTVDETAGGGYVLHVKAQKRHLKLLTAEGMFPLETGSYNIAIVGNGEDWSYKGRKGFYYSQSKIKADRGAWDYCYAWVDQRREFVYLNAYWLDPPSKMVPSNVTGRYDLRTRGKEQ